MTDVIDAAPSRCPVSQAGQDFDLFADDFIQWPYPILNEVRREEPVFYNEATNYWIVTRYEDVRQCLLDREAFSAGNVLEPVTAIWPSSAKILIEAGVKFGPALADEDDPMHGVHRPPIFKNFNPKRLREMEPFVREQANKALDAIAHLGEADLIDDYVFWIPASVIFRMMRIPEEDIPKVRGFVTAMAGLAWGQPDEAEQNRLAHEVVDYWNYARKHVLKLKDQLGDDFISDAVRLHIDDEENWPLDYLTSLTSNFLFAGHETTSAQLGSAIRALLENREQWKAICTDPAMIPNAIEEALRFAGSVLAWRRVTRHAVTIRDVEIPAGEKVLLSFGAANRDDCIFEDPDKFDILRKNANRHVTFGYGAHTCMGAPLSRMEMRVLLEELAKRLPNIEISEQNFSYPRTVSHRGLDHLNVKWPV